MITENLSTLKIHKLSQAQYDRELAAGRLDETAIYLTPDEGADMDEIKSYIDSKISSDIATVDKLGLVKSDETFITVISEQEVSLTPVYSCQDNRIHYALSKPFQMSANKTYRFITKEAADQSLCIEYYIYGWSPSNMWYTNKTFTSGSNEQCPYDWDDTGDFMIESSTVITKLILQEVSITNATPWNVKVNNDGKMSVNTSVATSLEAGLIRAGGDITVSYSGLVSVKDNSHKHTLENITGLQDALSSITVDTATNNTLGIVKGKDIIFEADLLGESDIYTYCEDSIKVGAVNADGWVDNYHFDASDTFMIKHKDIPDYVKLSIGLTDAASIADQQVVKTNTPFEAYMGFAYLRLTGEALSYDPTKWEVYAVHKYEQTKIGDVSVNSDGTMNANIPITETSIRLADSITGELYNIVIENGVLKATKI